MESIVCTFCQNPSSDVAIVENGYQGRRCADCGLIYISPRPSQSETAQLYTEHHAVLYADAQLDFEGFKEKEARDTLAIIRKFRSGGTLLELGAGGGSFLVSARKSGFVPYAIEPNPIEAAWIQENLRIPCESSLLNPDTFGGKKFDVIYHRDVLSHLYDPVQTFKMIHQALKDKGVVVFETGNIADVRAKYLGIFSQFLYPDHLYFFGEKSLELLLEQSGFKCLKMDRNSIILGLVLQKALWNFKERLKDDKRVGASAPAHSVNDQSKSVPSAKRRLRLLYRYICFYLDKLGAILPKDGLPLKLVVVAEKK